MDYAYTTEPQVHASGTAVFWPRGKVLGGSSSLNGMINVGIDRMAVVDPSLTVHGVPGLRVADSSVMPAVTSGNTNAATIMIGERCADIILTATR